MIDEAVRPVVAVRSARRSLFVAMALVVVPTLAAGGVALTLTGTHAAKPPARTPTLSVPTPPHVVIGALVENRRGGLHYGTPVPPRGGWCSLGACWSTFVTARGYVYPVRGSYGASHWHIAGPALAGPGVSPRDHFISVDSRSSTRAVVWTGPDSFASTHDGGLHWYRVTSITHLVAFGDAGAKWVSITIGLPGPSSCDFYFTYSSISGTVWRRGSVLKNFTPTAPTPQTPSCLETGRF
jgi:hypothetical protein